MANKTKVEAVTTWGQAEDVTIIGKHSCNWEDRRKSGLIFLMDRPVKKIFEDRPEPRGSLSMPTHGYAADWHLSMTKEEAEELAISLLQAARAARELDNSYTEHTLKEYARREAHYEATGEWIDSQHEVLRHDDELREAQNYLASEPLPEYLEKHVKKIPDGE